MNMLPLILRKATRQPPLGCWTFAFRWISLPITAIFFFFYCNFLDKVQIRNFRKTCIYLTFIFLPFLAISHFNSWYIAKILSDMLTFSSCFSCLVFSLLFIFFFIFLLFSFLLYLFFFFKVACFSAVLMSLFITSMGWLDPLIPAATDT